MTARFWVGATALVHFAFMIVEMFFWVWLSRDMVGLFPAEVATGADEIRAALEHAVADAEAAATIGFNMGLYNGLFAVGLTATLFGSLSAERAEAIQVFILFSVVVAGIVGFLTLGGITFLAGQAAPAIIALALMWKERA